MPFLIVCYFVAYLDRVNVGFAKLTMDADIGVSDTMFGFGAGVFFLGYFLFEVPSNLALDRFGARRWIARIMLSWGLISGAMAFIPDIAKALASAANTPFTRCAFCSASPRRVSSRHHLSILTLWFPSTYRGRMSDISCRRYRFPPRLARQFRRRCSGSTARSDSKDGNGCSSPRRRPRSILGVATYFYLTDRPANARWLDADARNWLTTGSPPRKGARKVSPAERVAKPLRPARVRHVAHLFRRCRLPLRRRLLAADDRQGLRRIDRDDRLDQRDPLFVGFVGMIWWGMRSDARMERTIHLAIPLGFAAIGVGARRSSPIRCLKMIALTFGAFGVYATLPVFWTLPTAILSGASAAAGIAAINSIGNLSGYSGPFVIGWIKDAHRKLRLGPRDRRRMFRGRRW